MSGDWVRHILVAPGEFVEAGPYITSPAEAAERAQAALRLAEGAAEQAEGERRGVSRMIVHLRVDTSLIEAKLAEAREAAIRAAAEQLAEPRAPTLEGLRDGLDDLLDGDDETAAELIQLAETLDLSHSLGSAVWEALSAFRAAMEQVSEAKRQVETEIRRRGRRIVQADDMEFEAINALNTAGVITADNIATDPTTRTVRLNPALGVPPFGHVTAEDLRALDAAVEQLNQLGAQAAQVSLSAEGLRVGGELVLPAVPPATPTEGLSFSHAAAENLSLSSFGGLSATPGTPEAPTLTRAEIEAAQELREVIRGKVEAAHTAGRRVNVLELGQREAVLLGPIDGYLIELGGEELVELALRHVGLPSALSVYYDPEV